MDTLEKVSCKGCRKKFPRRELTYVKDKLYCGSCFSKALKKLLEDIRKINKARKEIEGRRE